MPASVADNGVHHGTAVEQQAWLADALHVPVNEPAVRVWGYRAPAVVLGCAQRPDAEIARRAPAAGVPVCVRRSGGGAVLAGPWMLSATVVLPPRHPLAAVASIPASFRWFGLAHVAWLTAVGVDACARPKAMTPVDPAVSWACFAGLSHWEVQAGGRKIVGLAQTRGQHGIVLCSAALIAPPPWELLCDMLDQPRTHALALARLTTSCSQILCRDMAPHALAQLLLETIAGSVSVFSN